jgi:hypothetical protein
MKINKETIGFCLLLLIIVANLVIAFNYYYLDKITVDDFFYFQTNQGKLFDPNIQY